MKFDFATAGRIIFGKNTLSQLPDLVKTYGKKAFLITGGGKANRESIIRLVQAIPHDLALWHVESEPSVTMIQEAVDMARKENCDYVIGCGGGSVMDSAKAVAILLTNTGNILDYLEVVGKNQPLINSSKPCIAIPTTAGTGSEVTRNAVLTVPEKGVKVSMRSPLMLPKIALVDPLLTCSLPPEITASTGMDALTQVIEPYVSIKRNELTDVLCREGIVRGTKSLRRAFMDGDDIAAREDMSFVSLMGGLCLANAGLGMVHGFAGVIGGMFKSPHGAVCASLLPAVIEINIKALQKREPKNPVLEKYQDIASIFSGDDSAQLSSAWEFPRYLSGELKIPGLHDVGIEKKDFDVIIEGALKASSTKGNPIPLEPGELKTILEISY